MGLFDGIDKARITEGGNYLKEGEFELEVTKALQGTTRKNIGFMAVQMKVLGTSTDKHKIGEIVDWYNAADKEGFLGNAKEWAKACLLNLLPPGEVLDEATIDEPTLNSLLDKNGEMVQGMKLRVRVVLKPIKSKPGQFFSRHYWTPGQSAPVADPAAAQAAQ
jgi:hypothetical protein